MRALGVNCSLTGMVLATAALTAAMPPAEPDAPLAFVDDVPITPADLRLVAAIRGMTEAEVAARWERLLDEMIEEQLVARFLARRRTSADPIALQMQLDQIQTLIRRRGEEPGPLLQRLGLDEQALRSRLALPLAWKTHVERTITDAKLREHFDAHRRELDGTRIRARHVIRTIPPGSDEARWAAAERELAELRQALTTGGMAFEEAARSRSDGPSRMQGGDVGFFAFQGTMPAAFAAAAFKLERGVISPPVRTPFGVHLIEVTDEQPGLLSLEDVRSEVMAHFSKTFWDETVRSERAQGGVVIPEAPPVPQTRDQ